MRQKFVYPLLLIIGELTTAALCAWWSTDFWQLAMRQTDPWLRAPLEWLTGLLLLQSVCLVILSLLLGALWTLALKQGENPMELIRECYR